MKQFFNPRSIAIIGASEQPGSVGNAITSNILNLGYGGKVFLVNSMRKTAHKKPCFDSINDILDKIDLAVVAIPAHFVNDVIAQSADKVKNFVVISAGFSETGKEGRRREAELLNLAKKHNLNILGPNCLGFINPKIKLNASFSAGLPNYGNIAFVSQSGALAVALMDVARQKNLGFSGIFSIGNKMQIDESSLLEYLGEDENTKVIGMYLEGIKNGGDFLKIAAKISKIKPIVVLKSGKTDRAQKAISSHTGALAGSDVVMDAFFKKAGIIRVQSLNEFFNLMRLMSFSGAPKNENTAVVTNAGGVGVLTSDLFLNKNIKLAEFSLKSKKKLRSILPEESSVENPIDILGDANESRYKNVLYSLASEKIGTYIVVLTPQDQTPVQAVTDILIEFKKATGSLITTVFVGGERVEQARKKLEDNKIACFSYPEEAVESLNAYFEWAKNQKEKIPVVGLKSASADDLARLKKAKKIIETVRKSGRKALYFSEAKAIMALYGVSSVPTFNFPLFVDKRNNNSKKISYPLVVKVDSDNVLHKTEKKGVLLNIENEKNLIIALKTMRKNFPGEKIIGQPMQKGGYEIILGIKRDAVAGTVIVFGFGGIYAEVFKKADFLIAPCSMAEIKRSVIESRIGFLFRETRGKVIADADVFSGILFGMAQLAMEIEDIAELDINPLFLYNDKRVPLAADIKIILK